MRLFRNSLPIFVSVLLPCAHLIADESPFRSVDFTLIKDLDDQLIKAIVKGDVTTAKTLIAAGANVNVEVGRDVEGLYAEDKYKTVLMLAAKRGNPDIVQALIAAGADVEGVYDLIRETALMWAAKEDNADVVKVLASAGANVEATNLFGRTALIEAAEGKSSELHRDSTLNAVKALIAVGANVNAADRDGGTALMAAAKHNHAKTVIALLAAGADANARDHRGKTALDWAGQSEAIRTYGILNDWKKTH